MGFQGFRATHKRSKSVPGRAPEECSSVHSTEAPHLQKSETSRLNQCTHSNKNPSSIADVQNSLRREISMLEKRLRDQASVRRALEKALGYENSTRDITDEATTIPKSAGELIREISVLELEVGHLEQYLLSLYRKAFDQKMWTPSPKKKEECESSFTTCKRREPDNGGGYEEKFLDSSVQRTLSSLSRCAGLTNRASPPADDPDKAVRACHSQPLSMIEYAHNCSSSHVVSLAEHLGTHIVGHIIETPNELSEEMVRCMCRIYRKLAQPTVATSPTSSLSPTEQCDGWGPFDVRLDNPFRVEGLKDFSGPYSSMVEVQCIYRDGRRVGDVEYLLQSFRSLVVRLESVEPGKMKHDEKVAFWINVHNALVMHAFLAYGIPHSNMRRMLLLLKAAYDVGGQIVSADAIQSSILGCRMPRPAQWLRVLLSSKLKFKSGVERQAYGIKRPEPLLHFALSCGSHSDPAVRVFTPKSLHRELEAAREDYIRATFGIRNDQKILLPKIVDSFAKDVGLSQAGVLEMIQESLPGSMRKSITKRHQAKNKKSIEWVPHNFGFRYILMKEI